MQFSAPQLRSWISLSFTLQKPNVDLDFLFVIIDINMRWWVISDERSFELANRLQCWPCVLSTADRSGHVQFSSSDWYLLNFLSDFWVSLISERSEVLNQNSLTVALTRALLLLVSYSLRSNSDYSHLQEKPRLSSKFMHHFKPWTSKLKPRL